MTLRIIIAGFGGQGILSLGKIIAQAAIKDGKFAAYMPSYGAEMRGGTANCKVTLSNKEIASPYINVPDVLLAFNQPSWDKFKVKLSSASLALVNASLVEAKGKTKAKKVLFYPFTQIAKDLGLEKAANIVALGKLFSVAKFVKESALVLAIRDYFAQKEKLVEQNLKAFQKGKSL